MDHSNDQLRRDLRDVRAAHDAATSALPAQLEAALDPASGTTSHRASVLSGGLTRRNVLALGGFTVATTAVLAACGTGTPSGNVPQGGGLPASTALPQYPVTDATLLRTASSLEYNLIDAYGAVFALLSKEAQPVATLFAEQHREHAAAFEKATTDAGGTPFTKANPIVYAKVIEPAFALLAKAGNQPDDALSLVYGLETLAAESYQYFTPQLSTPAPRTTTMSVGGVEARHAAIWAGMSPNSQVTPITIQTTDVSTTAAPSTTSASGVQVPTRYQVDGAFQSLVGVQLAFGDTLFTIAPLGPNSYEYAELGQ